MWLDALMRAVQQFVATVSAGMDSGRGEKDGVAKQMMVSVLKNDGGVPRSRQKPPQDLITEVV